MQKTLDEIAAIVDGEIVGDSDLVVTGLTGIKEAQKGDLTFVANSKYFPLVEKTLASAIIAPRDFESAEKTIIRTDNPSLAFSKIAALFIEEQATFSRGIHATAVVSETAVLGKDVSVGPYAVVEDGAAIGKNSVIGTAVCVGRNAVVGEDCLFYPHVTIRERVLIGDRVIVHSGAIVGSDGFGFVNVENAHVKIPQIGTVEVQDDVEIGANVTIDRARFEKTIIGRGTKIDNLVHVAHNVVIGENCILVAQAGISGSCTLEDNVIIAGQGGLAGHLKIGEGAIVAAQAGVVNDVPPHTMVSGYPAKPHRHAKRVNACLQNLPEYIKRLNDLKKRVEELEGELERIKSSEVAE